MSSEHKNDVMVFILENYPRWPVTEREAAMFQLPHGWQWVTCYETRVMHAWDGILRGYDVKFGEYCEVIRKFEREFVK